MNCQIGKRKLVDYHKGKVSLKEYQQINHHIATCDECACTLDEIINGKSEPKQRNVVKQKKNNKYLAGLVFIMVLLSYLFMSGRIDLLEKNQASFGEAVHIGVVSNNIEFIVTHVAADEEATIVYFEIRDLSKQSNLFTDYNRMDIDENMVSPYASSHLLIYDQEEGVSRGKLQLLPILKDEETLSIHVKELFRSANLKMEPYSMEWFQPENQIAVKGDWRLEIPIKKHEQITYKINETADMHGTKVSIVQLIARPTQTVLTFQYQRDNSNEHNRMIRLSHLEADGERYPINYFQEEVGDGISTQTVYLDSMFFNQPKEVEIHFATMVQHIANQEKIEFDLEDVPFTFEYVGEKITVENVEVGDPTKIAVKELYHDERSYNSLMIESRHFQFSGSSLHEVISSSTGVWIDKDGNVFEDIKEVEDPQLSTFFTTEQYFEIQPNTDGNFFEPTFLYIRGYTKETLIDRKITVSLLEQEGE